MPENNLESSYIPDENAERVPLGSIGIALPGTLRIEHEPATNQAVSFRVDLIEGVGVRPTAITVSSLTGEEITSTDLRAVKAKNLWRAAIVNHATYERMFVFDWEAKDNFFMVQDSPIQFSDDVLERIRLQGPTRDTLEYVVDLYMFADSIGLAPVQYVQHVFAGKELDPLPRTTVTKWIKKARDTGLFEGWFNGDD